MSTHRHEHTATLVETIAAVRTMVADDPLAVMYLEFITGEAQDHETADDVAYVAGCIAAGIRQALAAAGRAL